MPLVTLTGNEAGRPPVFQVAIIAVPDVFAQLDALDVDFLPTQTPMPDGRMAVEAVVRADQLAPLVAAGATVELKHLIDLQFPQSRIMSSEEARGRLRGLERFRDQAGG